MNRRQFIKGCFASALAIALGRKRKKIRSKPINTNPLLSGELGQFDNMAFNFHPYQKEMLRWLEDDKNKLTIIPKGRRYGKSYLRKTWKKDHGR
jgi:hypothetical protein